MPAKPDDLLRTLGKGTVPAPISSPGDDQVQAFLDLIDSMRSLGSWEWADDTLSGIYDTVSERRFVSREQKRAITNIGEAREEAWEELEGEREAAFG